MKLFISFFILIIFLFGFTTNEENVFMKGTWTQIRPPYRIDTLVISDSTLYYKFRCCDTIKVEWFGEILPQNSKNHLLYKRSKILHNNKIIEFVDSLVYLQFELTDKNLWTYSKIGELPDRNYVKINSFRNTWESSSFKQYNRTVFKDCDDAIVYSVYHFQNNDFEKPLVSIPPKYIFGEDSLQNYFYTRMKYNSNDLKDIFIKLNFKFTVKCDGRVSN